MKISKAIVGSFSVLAIAGGIMAAGATTASAISAVPCNDDAYARLDGSFSAQYPQTPKHECYAYAGATNTWMELPTNMWGGNNAGHVHNNADVFFYKWSDTKLNPSFPVTMVQIN